MYPIFSTSLGLTPLTTSVIVISGISFVLMFGIASAKGGFQDLVKTTLENDAKHRDQNKN